MAGVLTAYVCLQISVDDLIRSWQRISLPWLAANVVAFASVLVASAYRARWLVGERLSFVDALRLMAAQTALGNLVATSAGAAAFVSLLRIRHKIGLTHGIGSLLLSRLGDLFVLTLALGLTILHEWPEISSLRQLSATTFALLATACMVLATLFALRGPLARLAEPVAGRLYTVERPLVGHLSTWLRRLAQQEPGQAPVRVTAVMAQSGFVFIASVTFAYTGIRLFAVSIDPWPVVFVLVLTQVLALFPVQILGGLGVNEATALYIYGEFGFGASQIAPALIGGRICFYILNLLLLLELAIESRQTTVAAHD